MTNSDYYCKTKIPVPSVDWNSVWGETFPVGYPKWKAMDRKKNFWPNEIHDKFDSINLSPGLMRVFKWGPRTTFPWHIDGSASETTLCAINWVVSGEGRIQWDTNLKLAPDPSGITSGLKHGTATDRYTCQSEDNGNACLVKTDIPHRVITLGDKTPRITISLLLTEHNKWSYKDVKDKLASVGLLA